MPLFIRIFLCYSGKVISAYLETSNSDIKELAKTELQPLIKIGDIKLPKPNESAKEE